MESHQFHLDEGKLSGQGKGCGLQQGVWYCFPKHSPGETVRGLGRWTVKNQLDGRAEKGCYQWRLIQMADQHWWCSPRLRTGIRSMRSSWRNWGNLEKSLRGGLITLHRYLTRGCSEDASISFPTWQVIGHQAVTSSCSIGGLDRMSGRHFSSWKGWAGIWTGCPGRRWVPWRCLRDVWTLHFGTWFSGELIRFHSVDGRTWWPWFY